MLVLEHMFAFEIAVLVAGLMTGAFAAFLPDYRDTERPIRHIVALALSIGALYGLLPVIVLSAHFVPVLIATILSIGAGFITASTHRKEQALMLSSFPGHVTKPTSHTAQTASITANEVTSRVA